jgi:tRNA pseudouridine13 synthase
MYEKRWDTFFVEEIVETLPVLRIGRWVQAEQGSGDYLFLAVEKMGWSTVDLVREMAHRLHIPLKHITFAGNKDRRATTIQYFAVKLSHKRVKDVVNTVARIKNVFVRGYFLRSWPLKLGVLTGNRFVVVVPKPLKRVDTVFPNFFGNQRFGSVRRITHLVGEELVRGSFRRAVEVFLCHGDEPFRQRLREEGDFAKALTYFPEYARFERMVLQWLAHHPRDYLNALRRLPRSLLLMFVHAFQSHLFNVYLKERMTLGFDVLMENEYRCARRGVFPVVEQRGDYLPVGQVIGYKSVLNDLEKEVLERFYVRPEDFRMPHIPELKSAGHPRLLLTEALNLTYHHPLLSFALPKGSYATVFLKQLFEQNEVEYKEEGGEDEEEVAK